MKFRAPDWLAEATYISVAAIVGIAVIGRITETELYQQAEALPFAGPALRGFRALTDQVFNP